MSPSKPSNTDDGATVLAGIEVPSSRSAWADTAQIIPFPSPVAAASMAWEDESSEDHWEDLGTLAVSLVADWQLPRLLVFAQAPGREEEEAEGLL